MNRRRNPIIHGIKEVILFPFKLVFWVIRGLFKGLGAILESVIEGILDAD